MENILHYQGLLLAGVDEVGRGPLFGAVVAAAVILAPNKPIIGLMDSKKLTEKKRLNLFDEITDKAIAYAWGYADALEIDNINILQASLLAMKRAVKFLNVSPEYVAVDGNRCPDFGIPAQAIVKGDSLVEAISAASILAKVKRDQDMKLYDQQYPEYGFASHKGYPTKAHIEAIKQHGVTPLHRRSFGPVAKACQRNYA